MGTRIICLWLMVVGSGSLKIVDIYYENDLTLIEFCFSRKGVKLHFIQRYLQVTSNKFYVTNTLKGRKCEDNSSCTNNQSYLYLSFMFLIQYIFEGSLFVYSLVDIL